MNISWHLLRFHVRLRLYSFISYDYKWAYTSFTVEIVMWDDRIIGGFISPSLLFNTYWIALLMEYLPLFLGSISSSHDKTLKLRLEFFFSSLCDIFHSLVRIRIFSAAFSSIRFEWWMISSYFCMAFASSLVFRSLLFGSSLYESLNFLKAWTLHRHRITF